jgi:SAM-dependent methyltransferase
MTLEIGAFDSPVFIRDLGDPVQYLDWFSKDELYEQHKDNPRRLLTNIVDVDYVIKDHLFARHIPERFDRIFAAHVVEHVADVVLWLQQLETLLTEGGRVHLAVPDRNYTFDYYRRTSSAIDIIRAHEDRLTRPSKWQIADSIYHHQRVELSRLWEGETPTPFQPRFSLAEALQKAERAAQEYTDVHCWVFTPDSFAQVMQQLRECGLTCFVVREIYPAVRGDNEFSVFLSK